MIATVLFFWPLVSWTFVPLLVGLVFISGQGGWDIFLLPFVGLAAMPLFALVDLLPRIALRSDHGVGEERAGPVVVLMLVHWTLLLVLPFVYRGTGDSGMLRSALGVAFYSVPEVVWLCLGVVAVIGAATAWVAALVRAFRPSGERPIKPGASQGRPGAA